MPTISKRTKQARNLIIKPAYSLDEGIKLLKQTATTKFIESAEAHFNLNLDTKYSDVYLDIEEVIFLKISLKFPAIVISLTGYLN